MRLRVLQEQFHPGGNRARQIAPRFCIAYASKRDACLRFLWYYIMMFKMSLLLDKIQQACDVEICYNIMQYKMSLLLDKIQQACDIEIWYNISADAWCKKM